jgi:outer membrane protein
VSWRATAVRLLAAASLAWTVPPAPARAESATPAPDAGPSAPATGDTLRLSLEDAVDRALARGEEMRAARAVVRQISAQVTMELSRALPQINGTVTYDRKLSSIFEGAETDTSDLGSLLANSPFAARNTWTAEITAKQLLWSSGKVGSALHAAKAAKRSAHASESETASNVTFDVKQAYYDASYAQRLVEIALRGVDLARAHFRQVQSGQGQGARSEYDVLRAQVDAANQEPALVAARRGRDIALLRLKRLANIPLDQPVALATPLAFVDSLVPVVIERAPSIETRSALRAAEAEVEARRSAVGVYRGQHWPDLYVSSTLQQQAFPGSFLPKWDEFRRNWDAYLTLEIPIFSGRRVTAEVSQARGAYEKARADRDQLRETVAVEAAQARADLDRSLSTLMARRQTVRQAQRAWELAEVRFRNGISTQLEVSDARLQLSTAEANEVQAIRDYRVALANLERAVGRPVPVVRMTLAEATRSLEGEGVR